MIIVTGRVRAREGCFDALREASLAHVRRSRTEPGCISHAVHVDCERADQLFFFERWSDLAALHTHFRQPGSAEIIATIGQLAVESEGPTIFDATPAG